MGHRSSAMRWRLANVTATQARAWLSTSELTSDPGQELGDNQNWPVYAVFVTPRPPQTTSTHR